MKQRVALVLLAAGLLSACGPSVAASGEELYKSRCFFCHDTGAAGAPKLGDKAAWAPRIKNGIPALTASAIKGKGAMPPKGGAAMLSDAEIRSIVEYIVKKSQ